MITIKKIILVITVLASVVKVNAQTTNDAGMWLTLTLEKKIQKNFILVIDQEMRLKENFQRVNLFYTNLRVDYKFNKTVKISPSYRAIQKERLDGTYSHRHRIMLDITLKKKVRKFTLSERIRYQAEVQDYYTSKKGELIEQYLRFKTDIKYAFTEKISPFFSSELRYQIRSPRGDGSLYDFGFHRIRNIVGFEYEISKKQSVNIYYLIQNEFNISDIENIYIVGIAYSLSI